MRTVIHCFALSLWSASAAAAASPVTAHSVIPYPRVPGDAAHPSIGVRVNGTPVEAAALELGVGYAHFAFTGTVRVEITVDRPIRKFDLSPHRAGIRAKVDRRTLAFDLSQPRKLHLKIDDLPRFFLFADVPEAVPPTAGPNTFVLSSLGVTSSPDLVQTATIQRAIDLAAAAKGTLSVPPGIYRCGQLRLKSELALYLAPGAILKGTGDIADYPGGEFGTQQIDVTDCRNVRIYGRGVIDGQGRALRLATKNATASRSKLIRSVRATNITVDDVILRDSGTWGIHLIESSDLRFTNFKLISNTIHDDRTFPWEPNTDGFDPDNSSRVTIENGFISCNDDAIAVKLRYGKRRDMSDVRFCNNVVWTVKSALKIGSEVAEKTLSNVAFENNDVVHADRGIVVYAYFGGAIRSCLWKGNHFEHIGGDIKRMHVELTIRNEAGESRVSDLLIEDNSFEREAEAKSRIRGLDAEHGFSGVAFRHLVVAGTKRTDLEQARFDASRHATGITFE